MTAKNTASPPPERELTEKRRGSSGRRLREEWGWEGVLSTCWGRIWAGGIF